MNTIKRKSKRNKKADRKKGAENSFSFFWLTAIGLAVVLLLAGAVLFFYKTPDSIYVFPENPKQGDTVFIKVESRAGKVTGSFGDEGIVFYQKEKAAEWVSFLGIDADQKPGDYKILVDTSSGAHLIKEVKVAFADFSSGALTPAPEIKKNGYTDSGALNNIISNDNPAIKKVISKFSLAPYFTQPFSFPLSSMKKSGFSFGQFIGYAKYKIQHLGVDLQAPEKTEVYAINDGKVVATLNLSNYGKTVIIDHGLDIFSLYLHLDEFKVANGDIVRRGQAIGLSGETGYTSGPHLHFSMRVDGARVDPIAFINATQEINGSSFLAGISSVFLKQ